MQPRDTHGSMKAAWLFLPLACALLPGCCANLTPFSNADYARPVPYDEFYVGDTVTLVADWITNMPLLCGVNEIYSSRTSPSKFSFRVRDTSIASVTRAGVVTARAPGETRVYAIINDERSNEKLVRVSARPSIALRLSCPSSTRVRRLPRDVDSGTLEACWARLLL
jgi:hypothetical protein